MADAAACVNCRQRPIDPRHRPFCSERCRMADLGRWLGGNYRIAGDPAEEASGPPAMPEPPGEPNGSREPDF
jgi:endogenous inhibitor of DNA gyrase (YacG/DUF329 family)